MWFVGGEPSGSGRFPSVVFRQSRGRRCGARDRCLEGLDHPRAFSQLRVARGYKDTPVLLAPLDVGPLPLPPRGVSRGTLTSWWVPVFARDMVQRLSAKLLPQAAQVDAQRDSAPWQGYVDLRVGKFRPRQRELLRSLFEHGVIKFRKRPVITGVFCRVEKRMETSNLDGTEPIFVGGVNIQGVLRQKTARTLSRCVRSRPR